MCPEEREGERGEKKKKDSHLIGYEELCRRKDPDENQKAKDLNKADDETCHSIRIK